MKWKNELTELLQISYPIIQAPMLGITTPEMVASISNLGGLGSLPVGGLSPDKTLTLIRKVKMLTNKPFAVNLFAHSIQNEESPAAQTMQDFLEKLAFDYGLEEDTSTKEIPHFYSYQDQVEILLKEHIQVVSFTFGLLDEESVRLFKEKGTLLIGTATCLKEALLLEEKGIDVITAQGIEAGGHRGTFLEEGPLPSIGLFSLLPHLAHRLKTPILAAGGVYDGKTIKAALLLGAKGVQIGSAFLASEESTAIPSFKKALRHALDTDTALTRSFTGRWARGLVNTFMKELEASGVKIPAYPLQNSLTSHLRRLAQQQDNKEFTNLWAGQSASMAEAKPVADIFLQLIHQTEEIS